MLRKKGHVLDAHILEALTDCEFDIVRVDHSDVPSVGEFSDHLFVEVLKDGFMMKGAHS